jgi:hypothetical protein
MEHWDWLTGILLVDEAVSYTLPAEELSAFAGTEWADNDPRVFHGLASDTEYEQHVRRFLHYANEITGPGWANWPFGRRQLEHAVMCWVLPGSELPELLLLLSVRQFGAKFSYWPQGLYHPGEELGAWLRRPPTWDCRQAMRFLYQSKLLATDGLAELAVVSAIAGVENATAEILLFLTGSAEIVRRRFGRCKFLSRFDRVLPEFGVTLPTALFDSLKVAYLARNQVAHAIAPIGQQAAENHVRAVEDVLRWYLANV